MQSNSSIEESPGPVPMPALYRMPVFYLLLLMGAGAYAVLGLGSRPSTELSTEIEPVVEPPRVAPSEAEEDAIDRADGILRTAEGLRRKVVVKDLAVVCRTDPGGGRSVGSPLDYFAIRYVFGAEPIEHPARFRVGPKDGPPQGWVPASAVLEWDTRLMARPTAREG